MRQIDLDRAVAHVTGETVSTIRRLGFFVEGPGLDLRSQDDEGQGLFLIDWDALAALEAQDPRVGCQRRRADRVVA